MADLQQAALRNRLLRALPPEDFAALAPALRPEAIPLRRVLISANTQITSVHFVEAGIVSVTSDAPSGRIEIGLLGREGLVGAAPVLLDDDRSPFTHFVQAAGHVLTVDVPDLRAEVERRPALRSLLHRYIQTQTIQTAQTAFANARGGTPTRLARWLLMCHDRGEGDDITVTQEFMSLMLGVERPGVTMAMKVLEKDGLVGKRRGHVQIIDRERLLDVAGDGYGLAETEYARLIEGSDAPEAR
ncbi:Crp/Fnr family transcriptional regulator [Methylobacterium sp. E-041]|uniref:Crp/Fnr family transcriptional regulator n=1 Tax=unclassified Methylobacterium TaxID=2615210 RepID=UPI0011C88B07|nr:MULTISPECIES: Crp/Fnr family transcriptional regulator [unclassified Methylobacterium]MCJ2106029.1 Crp/Fnr family transcriptional regulator [Methylobacterium sp. E-041]TXM92297.1 Crp/Fnr family transcriptional regulator [Methylobacterium sp. WL116]TXN33189.1 Crp/Fnr family transcriptional regulator [Methylobacterium sp. WL93]TXN48331.1 Crp/Fnr family transcriptional regulator [Methylobacterium sp. WL119]